MVQVSNETKQVYINGQLKTATKYDDGNWYVKDDNGKLIKVDPNDLFGMNSNITEAPQRQVDFWDEQIQKRDEQIATTKCNLSIFEGDLEAAENELSAYYRSIGVDNYEDISNFWQRHKADDYSDAIKKQKRNINMAQNDLYRYCMDKFCDVLSRGKALNSLNLAQFVQDNLFG